MTTFSAQSIASSLNLATGDRLDTILCRYPRWIHAELLTHRVFSRNSASSRAIPFAKLVMDAFTDPAMPTRWMAEGKGMHSGRFIEAPEKIISLQEEWLRARDDAAHHAKKMHVFGAHKSLANRLLEPFTHITVLISSTTWTNFLEVRDHGDAEPHMELLAKAIRGCLEDTTPAQLHPGDWHMPFVTGDDWVCVNGGGVVTEDQNIAMRQISAARSASTSFKTVDGFDMTPERAIPLCEKLAGQRPLHASPFEHVAQADNNVGNEVDGDIYANPQEHGNFKGWRQWRRQLPGGIA